MVAAAMTATVTTTAVRTFVLVWNLMVRVLIRASDASEAGAERQGEAGAFRRSRNFDTGHRAARRMHRHADAVALRQAGEVQVRSPRRHLAGVEEQRHV